MDALKGAQKRAGRILGTVCGPIGIELGHHFLGLPGGIEIAIGTFHSPPDAVICPGRAPSARHSAPVNSPYGWPYRFASRRAWMIS